MLALVPGRPLARILPPDGLVHLFPHVFWYLLSLLVSGLLLLLEG